MTQKEAITIVSQVRAQKEKTGVIPANISEYLTQTLLLKERVQAYEVEGSSFRLYYFLATPAITNWYDSQTGWGHSDD